MAAGPGSGTNRRRSQRVFVQLSITVRGSDSQKNAYYENTKTLAVNAHGCLVLLEKRVAMGDKFVLTNASTAEDQECRVVFLGAKQGHLTQVGVEFLRAAPKFWQIAFPPEDWKVIAE